MEERAFHLDCCRKEDNSWARSLHRFASPMSMSVLCKESADFRVSLLWSTWAFTHQSWIAWRAPKVHEVHDTILSQTVLRRRWCWLHTRPLEIWHKLTTCKVIKDAQYVWRRFLWAYSVQFACQRKRLYVFARSILFRSWPFAVGRCHLPDAVRFMLQSISLARGMPHKQSSEAGSFHVKGSLLMHANVVSAMRWNQEIKCQVKTG